MLTDQVASSLPLERRCEERLTANASEEVENRHRWPNLLAPLNTTVQFLERSRPV